MKKMNKVCSLILALVLLLSMIPSAMAANPFEDVSGDAWYYRYVDSCYMSGYMKGITETEFQPDTKMTRAMLVTVLYRIAGEPAASGAIPFSDVPADSWFTAPITWAYENKVVNGTSSTTFSPATCITREDMVTIFYRYAESQGLDVSSSTDLNGYSDATEINTWAEAAMIWAVADGIIQGINETELNPMGNATRAECATIITRYASWKHRQMEDDNSHQPSTEATEPSDVATEPTASTEKTEDIDLDVLEQYGRDYAYETYGYDGNPNCTPETHASYYPAVKVVFTTMEDGCKEIEELIDIQYSDDVYAEQTIFREKEDGTIARRNLNVVIEQIGTDLYRMICYYGGDAEPCHQDYWKDPNEATSSTEPSTEETEPSTEATTHTHTWEFSHYTGAESIDDLPKYEIYICTECGAVEQRDFGSGEP